MGSDTIASGGSTSISDNPLELHVQLIYLEDMQRQHAHTYTTHHEQWAHALVCCDLPHEATTSTSHSTGIIQHNHTIKHHQQPMTHQPESADVSSMEMYCCADEYCDGTECGEKLSSDCCNNPDCEAAITGQCISAQGGMVGKVDYPLDNGGSLPHIGHHHDNWDDCGHEHDEMAELERWACSKEGCHAIQQYVSMPFKSMSVLKSEMG